MTSRGAIVDFAGRLIAGALLCCAASSPALAQWKTQTMTLRPGWNAVFLHVDPQPADPAAVFDGIPIASVWMWNRRFSSVQYIQDASTLVPEQPDWLHYIAERTGESFLNDLFTIRGGHAYLIELAGDSPVVWEVTGLPVIAPTAWVPDSYNLVGFQVDPQSPPTFSQYFAPSTAHQTSTIHRLNAAGAWEAIPTPSAEPIHWGEAYWVFCEGSSSFPGPLRVVVEQAGKVDFGRVLNEQIVRIENHSNAAQQIGLSKQASTAPPAGEPALAGEVPLSYWDSTSLDYAALNQPLSLNVPAGEHVSLRLAVRRADMVPSDNPSARYQSLLEVRDNIGSLLTLPVVARGLNDLAGASLSSRSGANGASGPPTGRAGLWVGTATIDHVSEAANPTDRTTPQPTASEIQIRLIIHVDEGGQALLLQQVTLLWQNGTTMADPDDPTKTIVDEPGHFVLVTRDDLLSQFAGAALRDGKPVGRRISSAAFGFEDPLPLSGSFGASLASDPIVLDYDDPLNPFKHRYHPDHDNLDYRFETVLPPNRESYTVQRSIDLTFTAEDPDDLNLPGWGDTQLGGTYRETVTGLHREALYVAGTFRLNHVSPIPVLNDGL